MPVETDAQIREILGLDSIAVVGCSGTPGTDAHEIPKYMRDHGYDIIPVNPYADEIFDRKAYDSLSAVPDRVDIVAVFRPSEEVGGIVDEAVEREDVKVVWTQLGISDVDAARRAEAAGRMVVMDRCLKVEHQRVVG